MSYSLQIFVGKLRGPDNDHLIGDDARGGAGDDRITGNASSNGLSGAGGADTVFGGGGNDEIDAVDGAVGDTVHCGPGEDLVVYDEGYLGIVKDDVDLEDCEHVFAQ